MVAQETDTLIMISRPGFKDSLVHPKESLLGAGAFDAEENSKKLQSSLELLPKKFFRLTSA